MLSSLSRQKEQVAFVNQWERRVGRTYEQTHPLPKLLRIAFSPFLTTPEGKGSWRYPGQAGDVHPSKYSPPSKLAADEGWKVLPPSLHGVSTHPLEFPSHCQKRGSCYQQSSRYQHLSQPQGSYAASCRRGSRNRPQSIIVNTHLLGLAGCFIKEKI